MSKTLRALALGDVVGQPGCRALFFQLAALRKEWKPDILVVNGENAAGGFGLTPEIFTQFTQAGVDVVTTGNHVWQKREIDPVLERDSRLLRPANYPAGVPGRGWTALEIKGVRWGILNLMGRDRMPPLDCPFRTAREILAKHGGEADYWLVDFHAEEVLEKEALGLYLDGKVSMVFGTHTHVQTADERILPGGTGYVTDLGMTGPIHSVIGSAPEISVRRSRTQLPLRMEVEDGDAMINGIAVDIDADTGKALAVRRIDTSREG